MLQKKKKKKKKQISLHVSIHILAAEPSLKKKCMQGVNIFKPSLL